MRQLLGYRLSAEHLSVVHEKGDFNVRDQYFLVIHGLYADNTGCGKSRGSMIFPDQKIPITQENFEEYSNLLDSDSPDLRPRVVGNLEVVSFARARRR